MQIKAVVAATTAYFVQSVYAHGYVPWLRINGATVVPGDITCSIGNYLPSAPITVSVPAGGKVEFLWNTWPLGHYGPVINYMAKCSGSCSSFKGDTGKPWFKISQETYANGQWASDKLAKNNASWAITIPKNLASGEYLLRHEGAYKATDPGILFK
ncbi:Esterase/lipase/thioesterase [Ceratobasidium sp. 414]|nr:Esterase/lipase/thioesterase [Ceratobasidium sp. 414]